MTDADLENQIAAAHAYEALFVPALFGQWTPRVIEAAGLRAGFEVLDVACGTGILARGAAGTVGPNGSVTGVDPLPGMLEVARGIAPSIDWRRGAAEALPFPDDAFDGVVSQFGMMFFADREAALREMLRVLRRGGGLAVAVWDLLERNPAFAEEVELLDRIAGADAADALRAPFVLGTKEELRDAADKAGVAEVEVRTHGGRAHFPSIRSLVEADLRGWLPVMGVHLDEATIERVLGEAEKALGHYVDSRGEADFEVSAHILSGVGR